MDSKKVIGLRGEWKRAGLAILAPGLALACASGCQKSTAQGDDASSDGEVVGAVAPETYAAAEVTPPAPVVDADPNIPLNEAVVGTAPIPADYSAAIAPPEPVVEEEPPRPEPDDAWIPGYWWWSLPLGRYVWVSGAWRRPPPDQIWFPGAWTLGDGRYRWAPGYWGPPGHARVYIDLAPPPLRFEAYVAPPGVGFVWTPGYYGYRGGSYVWVGGSWLRPPREGLGWIEPRYVSVGGRYSLQPGRWDFAAERRGTVYRPDIDVRAGAHLNLAPVPMGVVSAHANFVATSAHAIAQGATRLPNGGYVVHGYSQHGNGPQGVVEAHGAAGPGPTRENEPHGAAGSGPTRENEPHGSAGPFPARENEPHVGGGAPGGSEVRPGAIPKEEHEVHPGPAPRETPSRGAVPLEEHRAAAPAHGPPPVVDHGAARPTHAGPPEKRRP
jgi:hypothetical protein